MAIPKHYLTRRDVLHDPQATPQKLAALGREFVSAERYSEALDFFEKAKDQEGLQEIKLLALRTGDSFLLSRLERFDALLCGEADWRTVMASAEARGSAGFAALAQKRLAAFEAARQAALPAANTATAGAVPLEDA